MALKLDEIDSILKIVYAPAVTKMLTTPPRIFWSPTTFYAMPTDFTMDDLRTAVTTLSSSTSTGSDYIVAHPSVARRYEELLGPTSTYYDPMVCTTTTTLPGATITITDAAKAAGYTALAFKGIPIRVDPTVPSGAIYIMPTRYTAPMPLGLEYVDVPAEPFNPLPPDHVVEWESAW